MIEIYHNPRCSKSRAGLQYLEEQQIEFKIINYIKEGISKQQIIELASKMNSAIIDLVRQNEDIFKLEIKGKELTDTELAQKISENPRLLQRPIVVNGNKAVMARPTERIQEII